MAAIPIEDDGIEYPDSDGEPMAESDAHFEELVYLRTSFKRRFRDTPDVYVAGNLLFYYQKGDPRSVVAPDSFVVKASRRVADEITCCGRRERLPASWPR